MQVTSIVIKYNFIIFDSLIVNLYVNTSDWDYILRIDVT